MRGNRHRQLTGIGHPIVVGARVGASAALLAVVVLSLLGLVVTGDPAYRLGQVTASYLTDGVAVGAALGATVVATRPRRE